MQLILHKYLLGAKVNIKGDVVTPEDSPPLTEGVIVSMHLVNDEDVEYDVRFGDWVLQGVQPDQLETRRIKNDKK